MGSCLAAEVGAARHPCLSVIGEGHVSRETPTSKAWRQCLVLAGRLMSRGGFRGRGDLRQRRSNVNEPASTSPQPTLQ
ncbi:hypothetical protein V6N13_124434 [Hibiscus sabdariffa]|uniref:Uncharacterized protein n=1 Tax=Hibiscus sabdariffa TaxID=183260 RepID=A0ABR2S1J5_9ROSI